MKLRIATYNVNNLFERPAVMQSGSGKAAQVLGDISRLNTLLTYRSYAGGVGEEIEHILDAYGFWDRDLQSRDRRNPWFDINVVRGELFASQFRERRTRLIATGHDDWAGWVHLTKSPVDSLSTRNTARVITEAGPDVLAVQEVEDRRTLLNFAELMLEPAGLIYPHIMVIEGNDPRGIDVGIMSRFPIRAIRTHVDDVLKVEDQERPGKFNRDCPEYELVLPDGRSLWVLVNHLKSKRGGNDSTDALRRAQASRVREILARFNLRQDLVVVAGDLNDTPESPSIQPLLSTPDLHDTFAAPEGPRRPWTHARRSDSGYTLERMDFLLTSTAMRVHRTGAGVEQRGVFQTSDASQRLFSGVTSEATQASDHALVWNDFEL